MIYNEQEIDVIIKRYVAEKHGGYECGIPSLDKIVRFDKKSLAIVTARPSDGKTTFLNYYTSLMARKNGWRTLLYEFETSDGKLATTMLKHFRDFQAMCDHVKIADTTKVRSMGNIADDIRQAKEKYNIDMVIIDTFTNLYPFLGEVSTTIIGNVLTEFSNLAKELDICVILTAHPTKMNADEEINAYSICGSANFFNLADYIISLSITDREKYLTRISTLKIRDNVDKGICGRHTTLRFSPIDCSYYEMSEEEQDDTMDDAIRKREQAMQDAAMKIALGGNQEKVSPTIFHDTDVSFFESVNKSKTKDLTLREALEIGKNNYKDAVDHIRKIDRVTNEDEYKKQKVRLGAFTISSLCGSTHKAEDIVKYTNIIGIDVDGKDNKEKSVDELKSIINGYPYTFYSALSVGGKGLFALVQLDGDKNDFLGHFEAIKEDFNGMGVVIDEACKDVNRMRFVSYDEHPYINMDALVYTKKIISSSHTDIQKGGYSPKAKKPHAQEENDKLHPLTMPPSSEEDKTKVREAMKEVAKNHLVITHSHVETFSLASFFKYHFGEEGRGFLHICRKQRSGYQPWKVDRQFDWVDFSKMEKNPDMGVFWKLYYNSKINRENE